MSKTTRPSPDSRDAERLADEAFVHLRAFILSLLALFRFVDLDAQPEGLPGAEAKPKRSRSNRRVATGGLTPSRRSD